MKNIITAAILCMAVTSASAASLPEKKATPAAPALEATLDQAFKKGNDEKETRGMVNGIASPFSYFGFKPYLLAGIGSQTADVKDGLSGTKTVYNVGGGVKYELSKSWEIDTRYRYVNTLNNTQRDNNIVTLGVNYKF